MKRLFSVIYTLALLLTITSCDDVIDSGLVDGGDALQLRSDNKAFAASRADDLLAYRVYALADLDASWTSTDNVNHNLSDDAGDVSAAGMYATSASTGGTMSGSDLPTFFKYKRWWFVGITLSNGDDPAGEVTADRPYGSNVRLTDAGTPVFTIHRGDVYQEEDRPSAVSDDDLDEDEIIDHDEPYFCDLPDVRRGITASAIGLAESNDGVVTIPFRHACSKLSVYIAHASKHAYGTEWTENEKLVRLQIADYEAGDLDMRSGEYIYDGYARHFYDVISKDVEFGTTFTSVGHETLVFPTKELKVMVKIDGMNDDITKEVMTVTDSNGNPIEFKANYAYRIEINYRENGTYIVTATPEYYDWYDNDQGELDVGQPTLINGVVWADRNLGASSSTYQDVYNWENMRGYYYQVGRNIPYRPYACPGVVGSKNTWNGKPLSAICKDADGNDIYENGEPFYYTISCGDAAIGEPRSGFMFPVINGMWEYTTEQMRSKIEENAYRSDLSFTWANASNYSGTPSFLGTGTLNVFFSDADATQPVFTIDYKDWLKSSSVLTELRKLNMSVEFDGVISGITGYKSQYAARSLNNLPNYMTLKNTGDKRRTLYVDLPRDDYSYYYLNKVGKDGMSYEDFMNSEADKFRFVQNASNVYRWNGRVTYLWNVRLPGTNSLQPTPEGWRIPTCDEWASILPVDQRTGDITFNTNGSGQYNGHGNKSEWYELSENDPVSGYSSRYYCKSNGTDPVTGSLAGDMYIIKRYGTNEAYGLRITLEIVDNGTNYRPDWSSEALKGRGVLVITRYTIDDCAEAYMDATHPIMIDGDTYYSYCSRDYADSNPKRLEWRAVEKIALPCCGVMQYEKAMLIWSGTEAQYAAADEGYGSICGVARIKPAGTASSRYIYIDRSIQRFAGLSIRPVRDAAVQW